MYKILTLSVKRVVEKKEGKFIWKMVSSYFSVKKSKATSMVSRCVTLLLPSFMY